MSLLKEWIVESAGLSSYGLMDITNPVEQGTRAGHLLHGYMFLYPDTTVYSSLVCHSWCIIVKATPVFPSGRYRGHCQSVVSGKGAGIQIY